MARDRLSRKELKEDAVQDTLFHLIDWAYQKRTPLIAGVVSLLIIVGGGYGYFLYREHQVVQESNALYLLEKGVVESQGSPGEQEKKAAAAYRKFLSQYPAGAMAGIVWLKVARISWERGDMKAAREGFNKVLTLSSSTPSQRDLARIGLARIAENQGDLEAAAAHYRNLPDQPYEELKAYQLGRLALAQNKRDEARGHFQKVANGQTGSVLSQWARQNLEFTP